MPRKFIDGSLLKYAIFKAMGKILLIVLKN